MFDVREREATATVPGPRSVGVRPVTQPESNPPSDAADAGDAAGGGREFVLAARPVPPGEEERFQECLRQVDAVPMWSLAALMTEAERVVVAREAGVDGVVDGPGGGELAEGAERAVGDQAMDARDQPWGGGSDAVDPLVMAAVRDAGGVAGVVTALAAAHQLINHVRGRAVQLVQQLVETFMVEQVRGRPGDFNEWEKAAGVGMRLAAVELAAAWGISPREASARVRDHTAFTHVDAALVDAMRAGSLEWDKAAVIRGMVGCVEDQADHAHVVGLLVGEAEGLSRRQLSERAYELAQHVDPAAAEKRHAERVAGRRLVLEQSVDCTADVKTLGVPADRAAAAFNHVDQLARRAKAAGDSRGLGQLRADLTLALMTGTAQFAETGNDHASSVGCDCPSDRMCGCGCGTAYADPAEFARLAGASGGSDSGAPAVGSASAADAAGPVTSETPGTADAAPEPAEGTARGPDAASETVPCAPGTSGGAPNALQAAGLPETVLTVPLETVLSWYGTDSTGGNRRRLVYQEQIGPLIDSVAQRVFAARLAHAEQGHGEWRIAVTDKRGRVVQYHAVGTRTLRGLRREAMAVDQAWCLFPTCSTSALRCQADHATPYALVRSTRLSNMEALCAPDHAVKTAGGYRVERTNPHDSASPAGWQLVTRGGQRVPVHDRRPPTLDGTEGVASVEQAGAARQQEERQQDEDPRTARRRARLGGGVRMSEVDWIGPEPDEQPVPFWFGDDMSDEQYERLLESEFLGPLTREHAARGEAGAGRAWANLRATVDGLRFLSRWHPLGARWSDIPARYGAWRTIRARYQRWQDSGAWHGIFGVLMPHHPAPDLRHVPAEWTTNGTKDSGREEVPRDGRRAEGANRDADQQSAGKQKPMMNKG